MGFIECSLSLLVEHPFGNDRLLQSSFEFDSGFSDKNMYVYMFPDYITVDKATVWILLWKISKQYSGLLSITIF